MINFDFNKYMGHYVNENDKILYLDKIKNIKERFVNGDLNYWINENTYVSENEFHKIIELSKYIKTSCDVLIVIGIGGSYVGSKAIIDAFAHTYNVSKPEIIFLGTNLTSEEYKETLDYIADKEICLDVVSKSGTTLEVLVAFSLVMNIMKKKYSKEELKSRVIITTDSKNGDLRKLVDSEGYESLTVPSNVGGRFSCLTPVGLLPMAVAGVDIAKLLEGAKNSFSRIDDALEYAVIRDILFNKGKVVESYTIYNPKLYFFTEWLKHLFAETQGKDNHGILPISLVNTRDLHSLGQFLQEGNDIIFETIIWVENDYNIKLNKYADNLHSLNAIAFDKTAIAHSNGHTPNNIITIKRKDEYHMGELIQFFILSAICGALLIDVDPFNQPGVQKYKKLIAEEINL